MINSPGPITELDLSRFGRFSSQPNISESQGLGIKEQDEEQVLSPVGQGIGTRRTEREKQECTH